MADPTTTTPPPSAPKPDPGDPKPSYRTVDAPAPDQKIKVVGDVLRACLVVVTALRNGRDRTAIYRLASDVGMTQEDVDELLNPGPNDDPPEVDHLGRVVPDWNTREIVPPEPTPRSQMVRRRSHSDDPNG